MKNKFAIVLAILGFAIAIFLSCADNPTLEYPSIDYFFPESSSSVTALSSSSVTALSSSRVSSSSSSSPVGSACTPSNNNATYYCSKGTLKQYGSLTYGGKTYKTIEIGTQTWMAQNLNQNVTDSKCYSNSEASCTTYGRLYNWTMAMSVCPTNWHLPNDVDWGTLMVYINSSCSFTGECANAGKHLKATSGWESNGSGTDTYGFTALPAGYANGNTFGNIGKEATWWTSEEYISTQAYRRRIDYNSDNTFRNNYRKENFYSVRCIKN